MNRYIQFASNMCLILVVILAACQRAPTATDPVTATPTIMIAQALPTETATATATATSEPTATDEPTPTPTDEPTATPTATATATATATSTATATNTAVPPTAPTSTPLPPPAPPQAGPPLGPNLLANPGFESGNAVWRALAVNHIDIHTYRNTDYAQFVRSGEQAAYDTRGLPIIQVVDGVTPGETYRFGAWARLWSSDNEDRSRSSNAGDIHAQVCINVDGEATRQSPNTICSPWARPLDTWQYLSVDAVAATNRIVVLMVYTFTRNESPRHNEAIWDDAVLGLAPVTVTPTPAPLPPPARPQPVPFDAHAMRDNMVHLRSQIEQIGGILDRLVQGEPGQCAEFQTYYRNVAHSPTYHGVPDDWQALYNEYAFAADHVFNTNANIHIICNEGGGSLDQHGYGIARTAINQALDRLIPALEAANARLN